jgi:hypothetical protein
LNGKRLKLALAGLVAFAAAGCTTGGISENNYTCIGYCDGEPLPTLVIQAPDPKTACTEYIENCRGSGICIMCN